MGVEMWGCMVGSEGLRNGVAQSSGVVQCVCEATQARSAAQGAGARVGVSVTSLAALRSTKVLAVLRSTRAWLLSQVRRSCGCGRVERDALVIRMSCG